MVADGLMKDEINIRFNHYISAVSNIDYCFFNS